MTVEEPVADAGAPDTATSSESTASRVGTRSAAASLSEHPYWAIVVGVATVLGALFTILSYTSGGEDTNREAGPSGTTTSAAQDAQASEEPFTGREPITPGTCLSASGPMAVTSCDAAHAYEVFAFNDCSESSLVQYLGGQPEVEVLQVEPAKVQRDGQALCVVQDPAQTSLSSARNVLQTAEHSRWRLCHDARVDAEVPCSEKHTGEFVRPGKSGAQPADCRQSVEEYLDARYTDFAPRLQVATLRLDEGPVCVVSARGRDLLNASVRNLGSHALPLVQE